MPVIVNLTSKTHLKAKWKVSVDKEDFIRCDILNWTRTVWLIGWQIIYIQTVTVGVHSFIRGRATQVNDINRSRITQLRRGVLQSQQRQPPHYWLGPQAVSYMLFFWEGNVHIRVRLIYLLLIQWQFNFLTALNGNIIMFNRLFSAKCNCYSTTFHSVTITEMKKELNKMGEAISLKALLWQLLLMATY